MVTVSQYTVIGYRIPVYGYRLLYHSMWLSVYRIAVFGYPSIGVYGYRNLSLSF